MINGTLLSITSVPGLKVGHCTDVEAATGCTVILCEGGAVGGVDVRGAAPGTRETDLLRPMSMVQEAQAILLSGGSAFGLDAAGGVVRYLEERGIGFKTRHAVIPIVPAAILYDLGIGDPKVRPDASWGYRACLEATSGPVDEGSVGAGTGATVGKARGMDHATKGGIGTVAIELEGGIIVAALVAVNAVGEVVDPESGEIVAGVRRADGAGFEKSIEILKSGRRARQLTPTNTTIGVVATNATLTKEGANKLAQMAHDGLAMAVRPAHTMGDGDTFFALATGKEDRPYDDLTQLGAMAAQVVAEAILRAVAQAHGLCGVPSAREIGVRVRVSGGV